ncbi:MAG: hypothetical protein KDA24_08195 [Deltaproteobacteria bacterium]|nr:hypothetical protein [Deltaproteobacteria bacterium]
MRASSWALAWLPLLAACPSEEPAPEAPAPDVAVVSHLGFGREEPEGQSLGFDLDGRVSDSVDIEGCGIADLVHVETGLPGIDNSFAGLLPALELAGAGPLEDLIQNSVLSGELLLLMEMNADTETECVDLTVGRALGPVRIGGDGEVLPGQTFERNAEAPSANVPCASFDGTRLFGEGLQLRLPLNVFDEFIDITLFEGMVEGVRDESGRMTGVISGALSVLELEENVAALDGIGDQIPQLIGPLLDANADLGPTGFGSCTQLSVVLTFEAVSAFVFE